jgi:ABC-type phosphate/phosphonate transport system permease subunit
MQVAALQSDDPFVRRYVYYFITCWSIFAMLFIPAIVFFDIPEGNERFADTILCFLLGTMVASMFSFLLGSSLGSKTKDKK